VGRPRWMIVRLGGAAVADHAADPCRRRTAVRRLCRDDAGRDQRPDRGNQDGPAVRRRARASYAEATWTQKVADWSGSPTRAFKFVGGVTAMVVSDNPKSGITQACFYETMVHRSYDGGWCTVGRRQEPLQADRSRGSCGSSRGRGDVVVDCQGRKSGDDHRNGGVPEAFDQALKTGSSPSSRARSASQARSCASAGRPAMARRADLAQSGHKTGRRGRARWWLGSNARLQPHAGERPSTGIRKDARPLSHGAACPDEADQSPLRCPASRRKPIRTDGSPACGRRPGGRRREAWCMLAAGRITAARANLLDVGKSGARK
jgi:hypothetical protein